MKGRILMMRNGYARIETIQNGFLVCHNYPFGEQKTYFKTLDELMKFLKEGVFREVDEVPTFTNAMSGLNLNNPSPP